MNSTIIKQEDGTIKLTINIPPDKINQTWEKEIENTVNHTEIAGFRKGKAPRKIVEEKINKEKIKEDVLKKLLPNAYMEAIKEQNLNPIIAPRIHVEKLDDDKDLPTDKQGGQGWTFTAETCEAPIITLGEYKNTIQKITAKSKIVIPGKEKQEPKLEDIIQELLKQVKIQIPKILVEGEVEKLLSQLLNEIKNLGLSLDQYLASTHKTVEEIRSEYTKKAENDITFEFALQKIAEEEKITVDTKEVEEAIMKAANPAEKENLEKNRYLLASILRQQKTLDFLKNL